ncbi:MAG: hypothetical protein LRY76_03385 [Alphaproteobacteria bacterium]|nr:hypothetical protein [Alphaproteobacteria bacterium]
MFLQKESRADTGVPGITKLASSILKSDAGGDIISVSDEGVIRADVILGLWVFYS